MDEKSIIDHTVLPCGGPLKVMMIGFDGQFTLFGTEGPEPTIRLLSPESKISPLV